MPEPVLEHAAPIRRRRAWQAGAAIVVSAGLALAIFWTFFRYEVFPKRLVEVEDGLLFRSGQIAPGLIRETLEENGIRLVIDLQVPDESPEQKAEVEACRALGIEHLQLPLGGDGTGDPTHYALAIAAIESARRKGEPTLVHCAGGSRRAGGVAAMYEVLVAGKSADEAYEELARYGSPAVADTPLLPFLNENMGPIAEQLVEMGVLEEVPAVLPQFAPR